MTALREMTSLQDTMCGWRRELHANPETAFEERRTSGFVADTLRSFGIDVYTGIAETGVVGVIQGEAPGPWVGLRADMDALDIMEKNEFDHRSRCAGKMHACGHDGHTAMLLGAANYLAQTREFPGTVALVFQPAEENEGGAWRMVEEGLFERFPIDVIYGLHNRPDIPAGNFAIGVGALMASYDIFEITLRGHGAHAALPHLGRDSIVAAAQLITALQTIVSRDVSPLDAAVVSVTEIRGGETWNVLPEEVRLRGTARTLDRQVQDLVERRIGEIVQGIGVTFGIRSALRYERRYPVTVNCNDQAELAANAAIALVGEVKVDRNPRPSMGSEDFAFLLAKRPGAYIWLGAGRPGQAGLHNPEYDFNDDILAIGASYWVEVVRQTLGTATGLR